MSARGKKSIINFGLLSIPVKIFNATSSERVSFKMISPEGNPVRQPCTDPKSGNTYSKKYTAKGIEVDKNNIVTFTKADVDSFASSRNGNIDIKDYIPSGSVDMINVDKSYYVKPDKGGDTEFKLFVRAMSEENVDAVAKWSTDKDSLILIRPYRGGLIIHQLFFSNEVRDYSDNCAVMDFDETQISRAKSLIRESFSDTFDSRNYRDEYKDRVLSVMNAKKNESKNKVVENNKAATKKALNMFEALKQSFVQD